ncbi:MAG TPA: hypothetical protein VIH27_00135 [Nitrososphaerales archaeon]
MKVKLEINGKPVEVNPYVEQVFSKVIEALASTLRDVKEWKEIKVEVEK